MAELLFLRPDAPDTVRVAEQTYLLVNRGYTQAVTIAADTVWVLDATQGQERARQDHEWVERLFGADHPIAVVVTDLAWPHIAGVRYWVAQGATIVSHEASREFFTEVVEREWTREPDLLERRRGAGPRYDDRFGDRRSRPGHRLRCLGGRSATAVKSGAPRARISPQICEIKKPWSPSAPCVGAMEHPGFRP